MTGVVVLVGCVSSFVSDVFCWLNRLCQQLLCGTVTKTGSTSGVDYSISHQLPSIHHSGPL